MLPRLNRKTSARREMIDAFPGLDLRDGARRGSFVSARNLSLRAYPSLCAERGISVLPETEGITDFFTARKRSFTVKSGKLYMDGEYICDAPSPRVSYAVAGERVFIIPGNIALDLEKNTAEKLDRECVSGKVTLRRLGDKTIEMTFSYSSRPDLLKRLRKDSFYMYFTYSYNDVGTFSEVRAQFNGETGVWSLPERHPGANEVALNFESPGDAAIEGAIIIPQNDGTCDAKNYDYTTPPVLNTTGDAAVVLEKWFDEEDVCSVSYRIISRDQTPFPEYLPGDSVVITNTAAGFFDGRFSVLSAEQNEKRQEVTLTLSKEELDFPEYYTVAQTDISGGKRKVFIRNDTRVRTVEFQKPVPRGSVLFTVQNNDSVFVKRPGGERAEKCPFLSGETPNDWDIGIDYDYPVEQSGLKIKKAFPELDFICGKNGRLCGVSNTEKKIYLSSANNAERFFDEEGGALSISDPSDGEFTGICVLGDALCCFKEQGIIKVFGERLSNLSISSYPAEGVSASSPRSLCFYGGALYYKGENGFYSYGGSYPKRISDCLDNRYGAVLSACVYDGVYYAATEKGILSLDLKTGLWNENDGVLCSVIKPFEGKLCFCADGALKCFDEEKAPEKWSVTFAPFYGKGHIKNSLSGVWLGIELLKGAYAEVFVSEGNAPFKKVKTIPCGAERQVFAPVKTAPCEKLTLKLSGKGGFKLKSLEAVFREKNKSRA